MLNTTVKEADRFEEILARHSAPSLLGIKPANLFSVKNADDDIRLKIGRFNKLANQKGLKIRIMCQCEDKILIMLYNKKLMENQLKDAKRRSLLRKYGYDDADCVDKLLSHLSTRIRKSSGFPHEIGIFLGYPIEDIEGFINNKGDGCKFSGYWKVYSNEENTRKLFDNYTKCRKYLCGKLNDGQNLYQALKII